jgi:hypothetical protein
MPKALLDGTLRAALIIICLLVREYYEIQQACACEVARAEKNGERVHFLPQVNRTKKVDLKFKMECTQTEEAPHLWTSRQVGISSLPSNQDLYHHTYLIMVYCATSMITLQTNISR